MSKLRWRSVSKPLVLPLGEQNCEPHHVSFGLGVPQSLAPSALRVAVGWLDPMNHRLQVGASRGSQGTYFPLQDPLGSWGVSRTPVHHWMAPLHGSWFTSAITLKRHCLDDQMVSKYPHPLSSVSNCFIFLATPTTI